MRQCMRCGKVCQATFCDNCRSFLKEQLQKSGGVPTDMSMYATSPLAALTGPALKEPPGENPITPLPSIDDAYMMQVEQILRSGKHDPITPFPAVNDTYNGQAEQALHNLQDAARRIEAVEQNKHRGLHAPRLSPLRDISADIQRKSTPIPRTLNKKGFEIEDLGDIPDLWSWLSELRDDEDEEIEEIEYKGGENAVDPLLSRHFPSRAEAVRIEEADLKRAVSDGLATPSQIEIYKRLQTKHRLRMVVICLAILAVLALIIDSVLGAFVLWHGVNPPKTAANEPPAFTLSSTAVNYGQTVALSLRNFPPSTMVYLTHDIDESLKTQPGGKSTLQIGSDGSLRANVLIDTSWETGFHTLQAEDMQTRYTASVTLHVNGGSTQPANLTVNAKELDLGSAAQGGNSMQALELHNSGSGAVAWVASSNQSWLQMTPAQGTFSENQTVMVGGQRANLRPGNYQGAITISSNVGTPVTITVKMVVQPLPPNVGAVLAVTPAVLSYTAVDGATDPSAQRLTINNPGKQPLYWSLSNQVRLSPNQDVSANAGGSPTNWLGADHSTGVVAPGKTATIQVLVHSRNLMPGAYLSTLMFAGGKDNAQASHQVYNAPQSVSISLTVQQHCGLSLNTGNLAFTAVAGQGNPTNQALNLSASTSCQDAINWQATSSAGWIMMTPANGQLKGTGTTSMGVGINADNVHKPGVYTATLLLTTGQTSHTVTVQLTLQKPPMPTAPIMSAAPLNLNFAANQGQGNLPGQTVTITNSGHSPLHWNSAANYQADPWLAIKPGSGTVTPGQTEQMTVNVNAGSLAPGNYTAQIQLNGTDAAHTAAGGSPQSVVVNFQISAPCVLTKPSSSALAFSANQGSNDPASQNISITASGNCNWPLNWSTKNAPSWLNLSASSGQLTANNPTATITVAPSIAGLATDQNAHMPITVTDNANEQMQGSPASFDVSLALQPPCSVKITPGNLAFTSIQGQATIAVQASDACSLVNWQVAADDGGSGWLSVYTSGSGILVKADGSKLETGASYTGSVSVTVSDSDGNPIQGGSQKIAVSLKIPTATFTISGTVNACVETSCSVSQPLGGAQVTLINGSGQQIKSTTTDAAGNFSFSNIGSGTYTITSSGSDSANVSYSGKKTISLSGDQQVTLQAIAKLPSLDATPLTTP